jgi:hypothetical protein
MALTTFNLAAIPVKFVAVPVLAGLAAGTGAVAAYVAGPTPAPAPMEQAAVVAALPTPSTTPAVTEQAAPSKPNKKKSCEEQTWPYIENRCIVRNDGAAARDVRLVTASREGESGLSSAPAPNLVTSDGVLRGPGVAPEADAPVAKPPVPTVKKAMRHSDSRHQRQGRDDFRRVYSVYSVPSADSTKPVIVVRPLRLNEYSSRF